MWSQGRYRRTDEPYGNANDQVQDLGELVEEADGLVVDHGRARWARHRASLARVVSVLGSAGGTLTIFRRPEERQQHCQTLAEL